MLPLMATSSRGDARYRRAVDPISFVENIKDNCEKLPESGLKCLNKCRFYTYANNRSLWVKTLEYNINSNIFGLLT